MLGNSVTLADTLTQSLSSEMRYWRSAVRLLTSAVSLMERTAEQILFKIKGFRQHNRYIGPVKGNFVLDDSENARWPHCYEALAIRDPIPTTLILICLLFS
ncbi:hypothetical protein NDU88_004815 [Pleurodeles waltl]|uniref:Uncharacterized protein n=1 Tax=Pleurodeles waltl TaxID=8319 RepID=A0AAV7M8J2_PLEWA|nr:hypothetical protein NDU88_004815 [Pleurodeles waltl]